MCLFSLGVEDTSLERREGVGAESENGTEGCPGAIAASQWTHFHCSARVYGAHCVPGSTPELGGRGRSGEPWSSGGLAVLGVGPAGRFSL